MRNGLLAKKIKRSEIRVLFIDDNQLRYNQVIDLLSAKDYNVHAVLLDDLLSFEKQLKQSWDIIIFGRAYDLELTHTISLVHQTPTRQLPILLLDFEQLSPALQIDFVQKGIYDFLDLNHHEAFYIIIARAYTYSKLLQTEQHLNHALKEAHSRTQSLVKQSRKAVAIIEEGIHIQANAEYLALFQLQDQDDLIGIPLLDILQPDNVSEFKQAFKKISLGHLEKNRLDMVSKNPAVASSNPLKINFLPHDDAETIQLTIDCDVEQLNLPVLQLEESTLEKKLETDLLDWVNHHLKITQAKLNSLVLFMPLLNYQQLFNYDWHQIKQFFFELETELNAFQADCPIRKLENGSYLTVFQASSIEALRTQLMQLGQRISEKFPCSLHELDFKVELKSGYSLIPSMIESEESLENYLNKALHQVLPYKDKQPIQSFAIPNVKLKTEQKPVEPFTAMADLIKQKFNQGNIILKYQQLYDKQDQNLYIYEVTRGYYDQEQWHSLDDQSGLDNHIDLILQIDRFTLETATKQLKQFINQYPSAKLIINLSEHILKLPQLDKLIEQLLNILRSQEKYPVILQFSEAALMQNLANAQQQIRQLHQKGVLISVRDFGVNASSPVFLHQIEVDYLQLHHQLSALLHQENQLQELQQKIDSFKASKSVEMILPELNDVNIFANAWNVSTRYLKGSYFQGKLDRLVDVQDQ